MFSNLSGRQGVSIFNHRRRPRQAVYASPQSVSPAAASFDKEEVPDEQLVNMAQDFENGPGGYNFASSNKKFTSPHFNKPANTLNNAQPLQNRNLSLYKHPNSNNHNNFSNNNRSQVQVEEPYSSRQTNSCAYNGGQQARMPSQQDNWYTANNHTNTQQRTPKKEFQFNRGPANMPAQTQPSYQGYQAQGQYSWNKMNNLSPAKASTASQGYARQPAENDQARFGSAAPNQLKVKMEQPMNDVPKKSSGGENFTIKTVDKSMKFVTSTIQGLKKWSEYREFIPLVFEIFATLDSVPTSNNNGTAKFFNIKDATGTMRSVYWEMDQKLPRMARGQTYRLTGALERKTGHFQCFTIRQAQPSEQGVVSRQVAMCDNAMAKVVSMMAEA